MDAAGYEYLAHVSDVRIRAWGRTLEETLTQACLGMWALVADPADVVTTRTWEVSASAPDLDELLVNLLNEQILLFDAEGLVAAAVESLSMLPAAPARVVRATLRGCRVGELRAPPARAVKAATYQDLRVSPLLVEVTLDV